MPVTKPEAQMLATLALAMRPHGAPRWEAPGVMAALAKVAHMPLADVVCAVARAASDRTLQTPGPIGNPQSPCWRERPAEKVAPRNPTSGNACWTCGKVYRLEIADDGRTVTCCDEPMRRPERVADPTPYVEQIRKVIR